MASEIRETGFRQEVRGLDRQEVRGLDSMYKIQTGNVGFRDTRDGIQTECTGFRQAGGKGFTQYVRDSDRTRGLQRYETRDSDRMYGIQAGGKGFRQYVQDSDRTRGLQIYERRDSGRSHEVQAEGTGFRQDVRDSGRR